jgi:hypothetical protein
MPILSKKRGAETSVVPDMPSNKYQDSKISFISVDLISPNRFRLFASFSRLY